MRRDREATERRIVAAAGELLAEGGFERIGVNAVARRAGVDKVLIYRYFGGLPGVIRRYAAGDFWPSLEELFGRPRAEVEELGDAELAAELLLGHMRALGERPVTRGIMRQELRERDELTEALAEAREDTAEELLGLFSEGVRADGEGDLAAVGALLHAGISYLAIRARTADLYMGVPLNTEVGRERLENAVRTLVAAYFECGDPEEGS